MHIKGHIRVLAVSAISVIDDGDGADENFGLFYGALLHASIELSFEGVSLCAIDDSPREIFNLGLFFTEVICI